MFCGSIREGRTALPVSTWAVETLSTRTDATFEMVDLAQQDIPPLTDAVPPIARKGEYDNPQAREWAKLIDSFDGFIFATPEYNASIPGTMKNAFDTLYQEWVDKPVAFIGWGRAGARNAIAHWRDATDQVGMKGVYPAINLEFSEVFPDKNFTPGDKENEALHRVADDVVKIAAENTSQG